MNDIEGSDAPGAHAAPSGPLRAQAIDYRAVSPYDWGVMAAGLLTFILTMISGYYTVSVSTHLAGLGSTGGSGGASAWHSPPFGWLAGLIALAGAAALALDVVAKVRLPYPARLITLGAFAVAALFTLLALFVHPGGDAGFDGFSVHVGHGFPYWACLVLTLAGTGVAYLRLTQTGGRLPFGPR